jgi:hypothetical protein
MCANLEKSVEDVIGGIIVTANALGGDFGLTTNPDFQKAIAALQTAETDVASWKKGTAAQDIVEILNDAATGLGLVKGLLPVPALTLVQTILAGIAGVIETLTGNSTPSTDPSTDAHVAVSTLEAVKAIQPAFHYKKVAFGDPPVKQYKDFWNGQCDEVALPQLKVA